MQKTRLLLTFILLCFIILMLVGCNILDNLVADGGGSAPLSQLFDRIPKKSEDNNATPVLTIPQQGETTIKLYFSDKSGKQLIEVNRTIPKTLSLGKETITQWLLGPAGGSADAYATVSPDTVLRSINIKNGIAIVDLSKEFLQPFSNITAETALYGLVNTAAQFPSVQMVEIRIEGKKINIFRGIELNNLRFRNDLIGFSSGTVSQGASSQPVEENQEEKNTLAGGNGAAGIEEEAKKKESPSSMNLFIN